MSGLGPIEITQRLVAVGRYSGNEGATADVVCEIMKELGYSEIHKTECGSVVGWFGPKDAPVEILFDSHIDIATVAGEWSFDPFCAEIRDGKLLGRGTTDMKGGLGASLYAVAEYAKKNPLTSRIAVSATVMEETIEGLGLEEVLATYQPKNVVICEPTELAVMIGQKGRMEIMLTIMGKAAHASNPEVGINSMLIAAEALMHIKEMQPPEDELLGLGILVPTDIITEPYPAISAIPEKTKIRFDRRSLPGETEESVLGEISQVLKNHGIHDFKLETVRNEFETYTGAKYERSISLPPWSLKRDTFLFKAMKQGAAKVLKEEPKVSAWVCCTNGSESAGNRKIPTIGLGPGSIKQAHIVDEFIMIDEIDKAAEVYQSFMEEYINTKE